MEDKDIIKALECCIEETTDCNNCPLYLVGDADCFDKAKQGALNIINRQKAEIERLHGCIKSEDEVKAIMKSQMTPMVREITAEQIDKAMVLDRIDAITEFAERLKAKCKAKDKEVWYVYHSIICDDIDQIAKELKGEQ